MKRYIIFLFLLFQFKINAQNVFIDEISLQDKTRIQQIFGDSLINYSFIYRNTQLFQETQYGVSNKKSNFKIFNNIDIQNNTLLPISYNDGNLYPARGNQFRYSLGLSFINKLFDFNFQPEIINNENQLQEYYAGNVNDGNFAARYFGFVANNIDNFRQFGNKGIDTFTWGQSRLGLKLKTVGFGISNQNLWVGPGKRNSITMTNNAAGFKHFYFNSVKPIKTKIGQFEFSYINGQIDTIRYKDPDVDLLSGWPAGIANKYQNKRLINLISLTWSPIWTPNLFIGFSSSKQNYKSNTELKDGDIFKTLDSYKYNIGSIFFRLVLPKEEAEVYGEIGLPDSKPILTNYFKEKTKSGILFGASKILKLYKPYHFIYFNIEFAQLQLMDARTLFRLGQPFNGNPINSWYTNTTIKQGYTNDGQIMGASIGPGSNSQTINTSWNNENFKIGVQLERILINNDFYYINYYVGKNSPGPDGKNAGFYNRYWVDLNSSFYTEYKINNRLLILANIMNTNSMNYRWVRNEDGSAWDRPSSLSDKYNTRFNLSMRINFN